MDLSLARYMVENLSKGLDPYIGRKLPVADVCSDPDVQKALHLVLEHCTIEDDDQRRVRQKAEKVVERELRNQERHIKYPNNGKPWTQEAISDLLSMHRKGYNTYRIASIMKRTPQAIRSQLKKLSRK